MSLDKIYSRPRIKLFKHKFKPKRSSQKINKIIINLFVIFIIIFLISLKIIYPIIEESCISSCESIASNILSEEVNNVMLEYDYNDLVTIEKNENGRVSYIEAKMIPVNKVISKITKNIQNRIDNLDDIIVTVDLGDVFGIRMLSKISPKINVKMENTRKN